MAIGLLLAGRSAIDRVIGEPPASGGALLAWKNAHHAALVWSGELAVYFALLLIPLAIALYRRLGGWSRAWVGFGCGILLAIVPLLLVLVVVQGRLTYPVYEIALDDPDGVALVVSIYYGGVHVVALMLAAAFTMLGIALLSECLKPWPTVLSIAAAVAQLAASYPWAISTDVVLFCQVLAAAWFVVVGLLLLQPARRPQEATHIGQ